MSKPKLRIEQIMDKEIEHDQSIRYPHCDPRVLHVPEECMFCAEAKELQEEREKLGVSNTGKNNRSWPCPADKARSSTSLNSWHGNRAMTEAQAEEERKEWNAFWDDYVREQETKAN